MSDIVLRLVSRAVAQPLGAMGMRPSMALGGVYRPHLREILSGASTAASSVSDPYWVIGVSAEVMLGDSAGGADGAPDRRSTNV
jgi:hypothetical protein